MCNFGTIEETKDELFNCEYYLATQEAKRNYLASKKKALLEKGDTATAGKVDAEISEHDASTSRVQQRKQELLTFLAPVAQINAHFNTDASKTMEQCNLLHDIVGWLGELELEPDEEAPWITTALKWFLDDSYTDFEPWLTWKFTSID